MVADPAAHFQHAGAGQIQPQARQVLLPPLVVPQIGIGMEDRHRIIRGVALARNEAADCRAPMSRWFRMAMVVASFWNEIDYN